MTNTELTIDQLQAVSGGATAIEYGLIAALLPKDQVISTECKVPAPDKMPRTRYAMSRFIPGDMY